MNEKIKWMIKPLYFKMQHVLMFIPDEQYLKIRYRIKIGRKLDLNNPVTYNAKLQYLKLYDRNPEYTKYADKIAVKKIVSDMIGDEYVIPTIGVWEKFDDINLDELPEKFVLKCTHDSGSFIICDDRRKFNLKFAKRKIDAEMSRNFYWLGRQEQYKNIPRRIIAEPYIGDKCGLNDYKFFAFDGDIKAMYIASNRGKAGGTRFDFYDMDFNHLDFSNGHPNSESPLEKPRNFEQMVKLAKTLSEGFRHVRVDFYESKDKVYFGEFTFYHMDGMSKFEPEVWDYRFGEWLRID